MNENMRLIFHVIWALLLTNCLNSAIARDVAIPDPGLNNAIRDALQKPTGPLTAQDLLRLTKLDACCRNISSLVGLEEAANLISLSLEKNALTNFVLPSRLFLLVQLDLSENNISSLTLPPGLTNLSLLALAGNQLTNLTLPPELANLATLSLEGNPLATLVLPEPLAATNLLELVATLRGQNVSVFTYPLTIDLAFPRAAGGSFQFAIVGPPGVYTILSSLDLATWSELGVFTNQLGFIRFTDPEPLTPVRFYRSRFFDTGSPLHEGTKTPK